MQRKISSFHTRPRKPLKRTPFKPKTALKAKKRKVTKASIKRRKRGEWSTKTADSKFSLYIRQRDKYCQNCGTKDNLTCSHYHRRGHSATRFDPKNCIALCMSCHMEWEGPKNVYTQHMIDWLGMEEFTELALRAGMTVKRVDAVAECKVLLESL